MRELILGIDPGLEKTAWTLLWPSRLCDSCGVIATTPSMPDGERIEYICDQLARKLHEMAVGGAEPTVASIEQYCYQGPRSQNANAFRLPRLVGAIEQTCRGSGLVTITGPTRGQALASIGLKPNSTDAEAKRVITRLVKAKGGVLPTNEHTRAAYAAAWWAASGGLVQQMRRAK